MANLHQEKSTAQVAHALAALGSDNALVSLCQPLENAYTELVCELLGLELWDWLMWWMYTADYGARDLEFTVRGIHYHTTNMTLYSFLEAVDASA